MDTAGASCLKDNYIIARGNTPGEGITWPRYV